MNKAITLMELIVAISLLGVIILGVASFDLGSRQMFKSSERKTQVMNEAALILDRIAKDAITGIGDVGNPAIAVNATTLDIRQDNGDGVRNAGDTIVSYVFSSGAYTLTRAIGAAPAETISNKVVSFTTSLPGGNTAIIALTLRKNPADPENAFDNPQATIQSIVEVPAWSVN